MDKINKNRITSLNSEVQWVGESNISDRLKLIVKAETPEKGRFPFLETHSGINAATWRTWWTRGAAPNGYLVEAAGLLWPQYAFWLATGLTDVCNGHIDASKTDEDKSNPNHVENIAVDEDVLAFTISYFEMVKDLMEDYSKIRNMGMMDKEFDKIGTLTNKKVDQLAKKIGQYRPQEIIEIKANALKSLQLARQQKISEQPALNPSSLKAT